MTSPAHRLLTESARCSEVDCDEPAGKLGLCARHRAYFKRHGLLDQFPRSPEPPPGSYEAATGTGPTGPRLWDIYMAYLEGRRYLPRTVNRYRDLLYSFWIFTDKLMEPATVTRKDLERFLNRTATGPRARGDGAKITATTAATEGQLLKAMYRWFADEGHLGRLRNPLAGVALPKPQIGLPRCLADEDVTRLLRAAEESDPRMATMLHLAYWCALRCMEIAGARVEDITPARGRMPMKLHVRGKGGKDRRVAVHPECATWLKGYLADRPRTGPLVDSARMPGQPMKPGSVSRAVGDFMRAHGVNESAHSLRHTRATAMLIEGEGRLRPVQRFLGHASSKTTERYTDFWDGEVDDLATR
jgi:integrase/recombinase XerC